jgi:hypothetical protein
MRNKPYTLESPEVIAILHDVWRSTKRSYYRITPEGKHVAYAVKLELVALGICDTIASRLLQSADLPTAPFVHNRTGARLKPATPEGLITKVHAVEVYQELEDHAETPTGISVAGPVEVTPTVSETVATEEVAEAKAPPSKEKKKEAKTLADEQIAKAAKVARAEETAIRKRYFLVRQGSYHGVYNEDTGTQVLFHSIEEAKEHINDLIHGRDSFRSYYASVTNRQRSPELQELHY